MLQILTKQDTTEVSITSAFAKLVQIYNLVINAYNVNSYWLVTDNEAGHLWPIAHLPSPLKWGGVGYDPPGVFVGHFAGGVWKTAGGLNPPNPPDNSNTDIAVLVWSTEAVYIVNQLTKIAD